MSESTNTPSPNSGRSVGPTRIGSILMTSKGEAPPSLTGRLNLVDATATATQRTNTFSPAGIEGIVGDAVLRKSAILLEVWSSKAKAMREGHYHQALRYMRMHWLLGIPAVTLSSALGTSIFASLQLPNTSLSQSIVLQTVLGSLSIVSAVLTACTAFLRLAERAEQHRQAAAAFESLAQDIDSSIAIRATPLTQTILQAQLERFRIRFEALQLGPTLDIKLGALPDEVGSMATQSSSNRQPAPVLPKAPATQLSELMQYLKETDPAGYQAIRDAARESAREAAILVAAKLGIERAIAEPTTLKELIVESDKRPVGEAKKSPSDDTTTPRTSISTP